MLHSDSQLHSSTVLKLHSNSRQQLCLQDSASAIWFDVPTKSCIWQPKENGRDTDDTQEKSRGPATALWFEEKCLCLPDTWSSEELFGLCCFVFVLTLTVVIIILNIQVV